MPPYFENKLGKHAIMVVFINTCSHKMINTVNQRSAKHNIPVIKVTLRQCNNSEINSSGILRIILFFFGLWLVIANQRQ